MKATSLKTEIQKGLRKRSVYEKSAALILITVILFPAKSLPASPFKLNGYHKNFFIVFRVPQSGLLFSGLGEQRDYGAVNNRLRLKGAFEPSRWFSIFGAYDFSLRVQDPVVFSNDIFFNLLDPRDYRVTDFDQRLYPAMDKKPGSFGILQNLDRAYIYLRVPFADITLGRQAIAWGSARVINPTDVLAPFTFNELDTEERFGIDAARIRIPIGMLGEFDAGYVFGKDLKLKNSAFFTRAKIYQWQTDLSFLLLGFRENLMAGFDLARSIGGAGCWIEAAYVFANTFNDLRKSDSQDYFRGSFGMDYSFSGKTYGFIEYHYNQAGQCKPRDYLKDFSRIAYTDGTVYLLAEHYIIPGVIYQLTPLIPISAQVLTNLNDRSFYVAVSAEYNIAENVYLGGGVFYGVGKSPQGYSLRSEFGSYPDTFYTSFRVYF